MVKVRTESSQPKEQFIYLKIRESWKNREKWNPTIDSRYFLVLVTKKVDLRIYQEREKPAGLHRRTILKTGQLPGKPVKYITGQKNTTIVIYRLRVNQLKEHCHK